MEKRDEELVVGVLEGDIDTFGILVERYESKLMRYGRKFLSGREDIEDIVQDVFLSAYQNLRGFDTERSFSSWIYRIAHNAFVNALRKKKTLQFISFDFDTILAQTLPDESLESQKEQKEVRELLDQVLSELPDKYREVLILHYFEELSYKEIADVLRIPTGTVGVRLKRAKKSLEDYIEKYE